MKKRKFLCLILFFSMQIILSNNCQNLMYTNIEASESQILSKDKIVKKFRKHKGKMQYRRWNDTKKCWVDSKWIDIS